MNEEPRFFSKYSPTPCSCAAVINFSIFSKEKKLYPTISKSVCGLQVRRGCTGILINYKDETKCLSPHIKLTVKQHHSAKTKISSGQGMGKELR